MDTQNILPIPFQWQRVFKYKPQKVTDNVSDIIIN